MTLWNRLKPCLELNITELKNERNCQSDSVFSSRHGPVLCAHTVQESMGSAMEWQGLSKFPYDPAVGASLGQSLAPEDFRITQHELSVKS
jgi:hypothetical protein